MNDSLHQFVNHPVTAAGAATGSIGVQGALPPPHDTITVIMHVVTFVVGIIPGLLQLLRLTKKPQ